MTGKELRRRETALRKAGYHMSRNTSARNDYSWFKAIKDPADPEEWLYMIEWRVWDWSKYANHDYFLAENPYLIELCIMVRLPDSPSARMVYPDGLSIGDAKTLASDFYNMVLQTEKKRNG